MSGRLLGEGAQAAETMAAVAREAVAMVLAQWRSWLRWVSAVVQDALSLLLLLSLHLMWASLGMQVVLV